MKCPLCSRQRGVLWAEVVQPRARYFSCAECKLIWLEESLRLSEDAELARYRTHENVPEDPAYMAYLSRLALPLVERCREKSRGLDFGCGPSEGMKTLLSPLGFSVQSYDPFFFPDQKLLNFRYDFVLCSEAAEHFYDPGRAFSLLAELVEPGGWLGVRSALAPESSEEFKSWWYRRDPTHVVFYRAETVRWIARQGGWDLDPLENPFWFLRKLA